MSDISENWLFLDLDSLKRQFKTTHDKKDFDIFIKMMINDANMKMPLAYIDKHGNIWFNEVAQKWERPQELKLRLLEIWALEAKPLVVLLTSSLKELAELAPDTRVSEIKGEKRKNNMK